MIAAWRRWRADRRRVRLRSARGVVLLRLRNGAMPSVEIARQSGLRRKRVDQAAESLLADGLITWIEYVDAAEAWRVWYQLTDEGWAVGG